MVDGLDGEKIQKQSRYEKESKGNHNRDKSSQFPPHRFAFFRDECYKKADIITNFGSKKSRLIFQISSSKA